MLGAGKGSEHAETESDEPLFHYPVGLDVEETLAGRASVSDDEWIAAHRLQGAAFEKRWAEIVGVDYFGS